MMRGISDWEDNNKRGMLPSPLERLESELAGYSLDVLSLLERSLYEPDDVKNILQDCIVVEQ